ncbi:MAG: tetratricopeptide repeat protein [Candidatus Micrarchaeota archaeon]|nr:tetratricopeptide repeat protein [Candidatus Micrarchaeota archaeon]
MNEQFRKIKRRVLAGKKHPKEKSYLYKLEEESMPKGRKLLLSEKLLAKAEYFCDEHDLQTAIAYCTMALIMDPGNPKTHNLRGELRQSNGDAGGALGDFRASLRLSPHFADAHANMALALNEIGNAEEAFKSINTAIGISRNSCDFYNIRGAICYKIKDYDGAIMNFTIGMRINPGIASIHFNRGNAKGGKGNFKGAIRDLKMAERLEPSNPDLYFNLSVLYYKTNNILLSMHNLNMAINLNPDFANAYKGRANLKFAEGDIDGYMSDMERYLELSFARGKAERIFPKEYEISDAVSKARFESDHYRAALNHLKAGNLDASAEGIDSYICMIRTGTEALMLFNRALELRDKKDYASSIRFFTKAIWFKSDDFHFYYERGFTKTLANDHEGAVLDFTTAINMGYRTMELYFNRGSSYLALKDYEKAAEDFDSALEFGKDAHLFYLKGHALYSCGNYEEALKSFMASLMGKENDPVTHFYASLCEYELGDMSEALRSCERAILLDKGTTAKYFMHSGLLREILMDYDGAIQDYTIAIKIDPGNAKAYERRSEAKFANGDMEGYFEDEQEYKKNEDQF